MSDNIEIESLEERVLELEFKLQNALEAIVKDGSILQDTKEKLIVLINQ